MNEKEYNNMVENFRAAKDIYLITYIVRCFTIGDEEQYQLVDENDVIHKDYLDALLSIDDNNVSSKALMAMEAYYSEDRSSRDEIFAKNGTVVEILNLYIWNPLLYYADYDLWDDIVCELPYDEHMK